MFSVAIAKPHHSDVLRFLQMASAIDTGAPADCSESSLAASPIAETASGTAWGLLKRGAALAETCDSWQGQGLPMAWVVDRWDSALFKSGGN